MALCGMKDVPSVFTDRRLSYGCYIKETLNSSHYVQNKTSLWLKLALKMKKQSLTATKTMAGIHPHPALAESHVNKGIVR